jgi:hypothetical protein
MLREIQNSFRTALFSHDDEALKGLLEGGMAPASRFDAYKNNVYGSLASALEAAFPVIADLAGEENLRFLAHKFIEAHPPRRAQLYLFGDEFAGFLEKLPTVLEDFPFLPDLARLEWAVNESYFAPDGEPMPAEALAAFAAENYGRLCLEPHPSVRLINSDWPIWHFWDAGGLPESQSDEPDEEDLILDGDAVLVVRPRDQVEVVLLSPGDLTFLSAVNQGTTLGEAAAGAAEAEPEFDLTQAFAAHLQRGTFINASLG